MTDLSEVRLETLAGGAAPERFQRAWEELLENIQDPNTDPQAVREVALRVRVKPTKDRDAGALTLAVTSKLAALAPMVDTIYMGRKHGRLVAVARDPRQRGLFDTGSEEAVLPINGRKEAAGGS
jgi:hypothetical protein